MNPFVKKIIALLFISIAVFFVSCTGEEKEKVPVQTVKVAIIDTGISTKAIPKDYISEGHNYLIPEGTTEDTFGHGTAVASVILEHSSDVILVPLVSNVYDRGKISFVDNATYAQMITDAVDVYDCDIINISSGLVLDKEAVRNAIEYAEAKGVLVVASAGNDYAENPGQVYFPAAYDTVVAVGSLDAKGKDIAEFSQRGPWIDVFAPGEDIKVATLSGKSKKENGSSFAAARVTAAAVSYLQKKRLSPEKLRALLIEESESYGGKANSKAE